MKYLIHLWLIILFVNCASSHVNKGIVLFEKNTEICVCSNPHFQESTAYLAQKLESLLKKKIRVSTKCADNELCIQLVKTKDNQTLFKLYATEKGMVLESGTVQGIQNAVHYFLIHVLGFIPYDHKVSMLKFDKISIPKDYSYSAPKPSFDYREPYFIENYKTDFRKIHQTHTLENTWGLWGHGIPKKITITNRMLAKVNGETYEEQLCFSSKELQVALSQFIKKSIVDNPSAAKFMIAPNDNVMACTCESCKKAGNTASNASPAVFKLINLLAVQFPKQEFYGLSYHSTKAVPDIELKPNVGVMYSTIHLPKGVSLKESNFASLVENEISAWNAKLDKIYIWDYVIHFDNYLNTFPTILSSKNNLMWLKELGVDGMFLQGNEEAYAAFSDLKAFVYGELLVNPNYDLSYLVSAYFNNFYPKSAHLLTKYYLQCEMLASLNQAKLDIYGGWKQDIKKYLHPKELRAVCDSLLKIYPSCSTQEKKYLDPLLTALTYQNLEVMRLNGILPYGLYKFNSETGYWQITKTLDEDFRNWQNFSKLSAFKVLNEAKITVPQYNEHWNLILKNPVWNSLIAGSKPDFLSTPDEVYRDASILTDGAIGFVDYYNNWLIATENPLKIKINLNKEYSGPATLEIGFLQQKRHRIFLPKSIRLKLKEETIELPLDATNSFELDKNHNFSWDVELKYEGSIEIFVIKQDKYLKFANALDEIKLIPKK